MQGDLYLEVPYMSYVVIRREWRLEEIKLKEPLFGRNKMVSNCGLQSKENIFSCPRLCFSYRLLTGYSERSIHKIPKQPSRIHFITF